MPQISVIVPVYKVEKYIHRCVDSVLNQTFRDFELILVDDGSPDSCGVICDEYTTKDSRIRVIHQENGGLSAARNAGIEWAFANSDSEWLTFIDSDDWVHPQMLEILLSEAEKHGTMVAVCDYLRSTGVESVDDNECVEAISRRKTVSEAYNDRGGLLDLAVAKLIKKKLFAEVRFPKGLLFEDAWTMYKIFFAVENISAVSNRLYYYFVNEEGITHSSWSPEWLSEIDAHEEQIKYMQANNHVDTIRACVELYFSVINKQYAIIKHRGSRERKYLKKLKRRVTNSLLMYGCYLPGKRVLGIWEAYHPIASSALGVLRSITKDESQ